MKIIGLTGGIAAGKSLVGKVLEDLGAAVIDGDELAHEVERPGEVAYQAIVEVFGKGILNEDCTIDRAALGTLAFSSPEERLRLERITNPAIKDRLNIKLNTLREAGIPVVFYMGAMLIENGVAKRLDEIWDVWVDEKTQLERLMQRNGYSREEAQQRIAAQMPTKEKVKRARVVIDNSGTPEQTGEQVRQRWEELLMLLPT